MGGLLHFVALANAVLLVAMLALWLFETLLMCAGLKYAYKLRLNVTIAALCAAFAPLLLSPLTEMIASYVHFNASDAIVAQYLKGNIATISATELETALAAKDNLLDNLVGMDSIASMILIGVFASAALGRAAYIGLNIVRLKRIISNATLMHKAGRISVLASNRVTIPFSTRGLFRHYVVLPTERQPRRAMSVALGHEFQHIRQHDVNWEILLSLISPIFVLNPAFWLLSDRIRRFREYSCDAAFLMRRKCDVREYCLTLLEFATGMRRVRQHKPAPSGSVPLYGREGVFSRSSRSALHRRIVAISKIGGLNSGLSLGLSVAATAFLVSAMIMTVVAFSRPGGWSHDRLMLSTVVNLERLDRINGFGVPPLGMGVDKTEN